MVFQWAEGSRKRGDAQAVGAELHALGQQGEDGLTAERVVERARDEKSALHPYFEWDDSQAAREYRLSQARQLVAHVVVLVGPEERREPVRAFVHVRPENAPVGSPGRYEPTQTVMQDPALRRYVLADIRAEIVSLQRKLERFEELASHVGGLCVIEAAVTHLARTERTDRNDRSERSEPVPLSA